MRKVLKNIKIIADILLHLSVNLFVVLLLLFFLIKDHGLLNFLSLLILVAYSLSTI